jgi:hypothetical protein
VTFLCEPIAKRGEQVETIEQLAESLEPAMAQAVRQMLDDHADSVPLDDLQAALEDGNTAAVLTIIGDMRAARIQAVVDALQNTAWAGGQREAGRPVLQGVQFTFNRLNPALVTWLETYSLNLIREIGEGTRQSVRTILVEGMRTGEGPIATARKIKDVVGLTERQAQAVTNYRRALETIHEKRGASDWGLGREIARRNGRQVTSETDGINRYRLRDFRYDGVTQRALETGKPLKPEQIARMVEAYARKYRRHRSEIIARTETLRAANAGANETWRQAIASGLVDADLVRKRWIIAPDERVCPRCRPIPKLNPPKGVRMSEPFKTPNGTVMLPPVHPSCRCGIIYRLWEPEQLKPGE